MPSRKQSDQSTTAPAEPESVSVYDFLYYDAARIASFLSQFDPSGHLTQITNNERAHRGKKESTSVQAAGSVAIVKGTISDGTDLTSEYGKQISRSYDPRWANALAFLDYLEERALLNRNVSEAPIGQIVLHKGELSIFDLSILQKMWALPTIKKSVIAGAKQSAGLGVEQATGNRHERRKSGASHRKVASAEESQAELGLELLSVLPHSIQAAVSVDNLSAWCTLREDCITVSPADLFMKHGLTISGQWAMVGIVDALPDDQTEIPDSGVTVEQAKQVIAGAKLGALGYMLAPSLVPPVRMMLGRPADSYGVTPLLLFRSVTNDLGH